MSSSGISPNPVLTSSSQPTKTQVLPTPPSSDSSAAATAAIETLDNSAACRNVVPHTTAFTVQFNDSNKFTKRHVRNLSLPISKLYDSKVNWDGNNKLPSDDGKACAAVHTDECASLNVSGAVKSSRLPSAGKVAAGNHSEGYFSSDAEDDPAHPKLFVAKLHGSSRKSSKVTNLAQEKQAELQRKSITLLAKAGKENAVFEKCYDKEMKEEDLNKKGEDEDDLSDTVSETGTYTIDKEKDELNVEVITARLNIDTGVSQQTTNSDELNNYDSAHSSLSWVNDWASHVVEHNSLTGINTADNSLLQTGPPVVSSQQKQASSPLQDRRGAHPSKIPSPLSNVRSQFRLNTQQASALSPSVDRNGPVPNKQSPRARRTITQNTNTDTSRQVPRDECSDSSLETESFLLATERVMTALQARVSLSVDSGGESDVDTSHGCNTKKRQPMGTSISTPSSALVTPTAAAGTIQSDSSASESGGGGSCSRKAVNTAAARTGGVTTPTATTRYNRAFSLRRGRLDEPNKKDSKAIPPTAPSVENKTKRTVVDMAIRHPASSSSPFASRASKVTTSLQQSRSSSASSHQTPVAGAHRSQSFTRTDCGRFSMRNIKTNQLDTPSNQNKEVKKKPSGARSNSTLSSREVEFQNWKRRKSYDPMKAAAEGKKKEAAKKQQKGSATSSTTSQPKSSGNPVLRSASFHGTRQLIIPSSSEEDDDNDEEEEDEEEPEEEPAASPEEYEEEEEDWIMPAAPRTSLESTPRGSRVSLYSNASNSSLRSRPKLEGVDNLVISALSGLSTKVRVGSSNLLKKLRYLYDEDSPKAHQLAAEIEQLEISEPGSPHHNAAVNASTTRSPSRELSTALRNLKRIESVIKVLDNVLFDNEDFH